MLADDRARFESVVRQTFRGQSMVIAGKRYEFPKF